MRSLRWGCLLWLCLGAWACDGGGGPPDGADAGDGADGGADGDGDAGPTYQAVFEPGARACAGFLVQRSAAQELALRARVGFAPQTLELAPGADREVELFADLEVGGPTPAPATPVGPATLAHRRETFLGGFCDRFELAQVFDLQAGAHRAGLTLGLSFCTREGVADPARLTFDADQVGEPLRGLDEGGQVALALRLDSGSDYLTERQALTSCSLSQAGAWAIDIQLEGGDRIEATRRYLPPRMGTGAAALTWARATFGGQAQVVDDPFRLAYGADLHNRAERFLVALDPPLGEIHGLHWQETDQGGLAGPPSHVQLLDAALDPARPLAERAVTGYVETPP